MVTFPTKYHGDVTLSSSKWGKICSEPERQYYSLNGEKVATALVAPDWVKQHKTIDSQFVYYKRFNTMHLHAGLEPAAISPIYFAVIIDTNVSRTVYPTKKIKPGRSFTPPK
jgi:hypothetical protein